MLKLSGATQCLTLYMRSRIERCRYNRVRLYSDPDPLEYQAVAVSWTAAFPNEDHVSTTTLFPTQTHCNAPTPPQCWFGVQKPNETSITQPKQCRHCTVRRIYASPKQTSVSHARTHRVHNFRWGSYDACSRAVYTGQWRIHGHHAVPTPSLVYVLHQHQCVYCSRDNSQLK